MVMATGKCLVNHSYYLRDEISAQLQSHSSTDCRDHYDKFYMSGIMKELTCSPCPFPLVKEHTYPNKLFDSEVENNPPCDLRLDHQKSLGYLPYRDEFEIVCLFICFIYVVGIYEFSRRSFKFCLYDI